MLTVFDYAGLCRMPLALGRLGDFARFGSRAARSDKMLCHTNGLPATHAHLPAAAAQNRFPGKDWKHHGC